MTDESVITHHANYRTISLVISQILRNSARMLKFRGKGQIPRLGSKFRSPRKTVGPRHQSPEWATSIASFRDRLLVLLDSIHPCNTKASWWPPSVLQGESIKILLASVSSGICTIWPNRERCHAWTIYNTGALPALSCLQFYVSISMGGNVSMRASGVDASDSEGRDAKVGLAEWTCHLTITDVSSALMAYHLLGLTSEFPSLRWTCRKRLSRLHSVLV